MSTRVHKEVPGMRSVSPSPSEDDNLSAASPKRGGRKESEQKRRVMMNQYFDELIALLSMLSERCIPKKMDKATTLHEAVQCIQIYSDLTSKPEKTLTLDMGKNTKPSTKQQKSPSPQQTDTSSESSDTVQGLHTVGELLHFFLDAHDAFLLVVSDSGRVLFSTELVTSLLGHMQTRLVGQNFFDILHENDHKLFQDMLKSDHVGSEGVKLKDRPIIAFPPKVVHFHLKLYAGETGYFPQYLQFMSVVYLRKWDTDRSKGGGGGGGSSDMCPASPDPPSSESGYSLDQEHQTCLVVVGKLPTSLSMVDLPVGTNDVNFEFDMRVSREGRVIDIDKHAVTVLGYTTSEIIGTSFFDYIDPYHLIQVSEVMSTFLSNGLGTTTPYRLLTKGGRSVWLISKGYLSYNPWNNKPDHILLTNRVLGCDQVLPEHRFFRSRRLLPDLEGHECYRPNIPVSRSSPPPELQPMTTPTTNLTTSESAIHDNLPESQFNLTDLVVGSMPQEQHQAPPPHHQHHQGQGTGQHIPQNMNFQGQVANTQSLLQQGQLQQPQQGGGGGGNGQQQQILQTPQCGPSIQTPVTPSPLQRGTGMSDGQLPSSSTTSGVPPAAPQATTPIQNFEDIQRELERKNREIFEMQKKLYEQQQLFEKERSQFYSITAQVMQCISSNALNQLPANMQMVFSTSNEYNPSGMLNTQSKVIMDEPLHGHNHGHGQPATHGNFSSNSVQTAGAPLWDSGGSSLGVFTTTSQQYPVQQSHQQSPHAGQQTQQQHQLQQSPYGTTPASSMASSSVNFTASNYPPPGNTTNVTSASSMQPGHHDHSSPMLSEQFGLSQAFKMSGQQSLAEHNMQFFHHIPPHQQSQQSRQGRQSQTHLPSIPGTESTGYSSLMSNDVLSNLASSPASSMSISIPSLPAGMHTQQKQQQQQHQSLPPQNLADVLNSVRFS